MKCCDECGKFMTDSKEICPRCGCTKLLNGIEETPKEEIKQLELFEG